MSDKFYENMNRLKLKPMDKKMEKQQITCTPLSLQLSPEDEPAPTPPQTQTIIEDFKEKHPGVVVSEDPEVIAVNKEIDRMNGVISIPDASIPMAVPLPSTKDIAPPLIPDLPGVINNVNIFDTEITLERNPHEIAAEIVAKRAAVALPESAPKAPRLYEITPMIESLMMEIESHAEENLGEMPVELCDALQALEMEREKKVINCALLYKDLRSKHDAIKKERKALEAREKQYKNQYESLLQYLQSNMAEREQIEDPRIKWSWRKSTKCVVTDINKLPEGCFEIIPEERKALISDRIKPLLANGSVIPGAELKSTVNLSIK